MLTKQPQPEPTWRAIARLLRWDKPAGRLILMIPALWAVVLASQGKPELLLVGVIILGTVATSAAGCVVNDLWDRNIDPKVSRTRDRPLASRALSVKTGFAVMLVSFACALGLAKYLNPFSFWLCVAAVPFIIFYPAAKRVFPVPQLVLSICWGFAVLICWSAVTQSLEPETWLLWGATVLWTLGFDTVYAMSDRQDDERVGVQSSARFFGKYAAQAVALFFAGSAGLLAGLGVLMGLNLWFWASLGIAILAWAYQYQRIRPAHPAIAVYGQVFRQNVGVGFILLAGMILGF
jgi:4-hydroxybenzoate polyprenyltransferase